MASFEELGKKPPQATDMEEAVLGAIMLDKSAFDTVAEIITPESFYNPKNRIVFEAMFNLQRQNMPIDLLTVVNELRSTERLEELGGPFYITKMTSAVVSSANVETHARIVAQQFMLRELIDLGGLLYSQGYNAANDPFDLMATAEQRLTQMSRKHFRSNQRTMMDLGVEAVQRVDQLRSNPGKLTGVNTGFRALNVVTNGWQPTDLIIIAARPSVGKTAFALNLARNAASGPDALPVLFCSLEMSARQCHDRLAAAEGEIPLEKISNGSFDESGYRWYLQTVESLGKKPIILDDTPALNILEFKSMVRRHHRKSGIGLVIVDYLQLMSGKTDNDVRMREQEISNISRNLKAVAKELNIPVIALSQMTRSVEKEKREPQLSDLRESGAIEQDADLVMFLWREDYQKEAKDVDPAIRNSASAKIAKHRNGKLKKIRFRTDLSVQKWFDIKPDLFESNSPEPQNESLPEDDLPF